MASRMMSMEGLAAALATRRPPARRKRPTLGKDGVEFLASVPLFEGLSRRHLRRLAEAAEWFSAPEGAMVVMAGQPGKAFFAIVEGTAKVVAGATPSGRALATMGPGDVFGEMALLDGGVRTASVVAKTPLSMIRLSRKAFRDVVREEPSVALKLLETVAARARTGAQTE